MRAAFVVFDRMTALDFVGIYDPLTRLRSMGIDPTFDWRICAWQAPVADDRGLRFVPDVAGDPLTGYDLLVVPGGSGTRTLVHDADFLRWFGTATGVPLKVSVCTGSLLLGATGFLRGKAATTHPRARAELAEFCSTVEERRIADAGDVVTAAGVTAGIDLGLYLVERFAGAAAREQIARQMDYPYQWSG